MSLENEGQQLSISLAITKADQAQRDLEKFRNKFKQQFDALEKRVQTAGTGMNDSLSKSTRKMETTMAATTKRIAVLSAHTTAEGLVELASLVDAGSLRPEITQRYPLERAAEAIAEVAVGHTRGKMTIEP